MLMRAWRDQRTRRDGYPRGRQEPENSHLALKPPLRIVVQRHSSGHHAGHDRRGSQVHKHVAPGVEDGGLWPREAVSVRNSAGGRKRAAFQVNFHQKQSRRPLQPAAADMRPPLSRTTRHHDQRREMAKRLLLWADHPLKQQLDRSRPQSDIAEVMTGLVALHRQRRRSGCSRAVSAPQPVSASALWNVSRTCACRSAAKTGAASPNDLLCRVIVDLLLKAYRQKPLQHRVDLLGHLAGTEVPGADGPSDRELRLQLRRARKVRVRG